MAQPTQTPVPVTPKLKRHLWLKVTAILVGVGIIAFIAPIVMFFVQTSGPNRAQQAAEPLDKIMLANGAVKKCGYGDGGRGIDNYTPWYQIYYELPASRSTAISFIDKVAADTGFKLTHATVADKGPLTVTDERIDNWYYDHTTKTSTYSDLAPGPIKLEFEVRNDANYTLPDSWCDTPVPLASNANQTVIMLKIGMPRTTR